MNNYNRIAFSNDKLITLNEAIKDKDYICPKCNDKVILCEGEILKYFRHIESDCNFYTNESDLHFNAKLILKNLLANNEIIVKKYCSDCEYFEEYEYGKCQNIELEYNFADNYKADLAILNTDNITVFEIFATHKTSEFNRDNVSWYELNAQDIVNGNTEFICQRDFTCNNCIDNYKPGIIYANQRGAGCGKTYESIQLLTGNDIKFSSKNTFIYLTKMHSAKDVILEELRSQYGKGKLLDLVQDECYDDKNNKQYKITFIKNEIKITIIIGTVDSFLYSLVDIDKVINVSGNYFSDIRQSIISGNIQITKNNIIKYSQTDIPLRNNTLIIIDEAQDLSVDYLECFDYIIQNCSSDLYLIGDKLQSIWFEENIYTHIFSEYCNTRSTIIRDISDNIIRRFHNNIHMHYVNRLIKFNPYGLQEIVGVCQDANCDINHNIRSIDCIKIDRIFNDNRALNRNIERIKEKIEYLLLLETYMPGDFMFIFPMIANNPLASRLVDFLNEFWCRKLGTNSTYAFLHKSEDNKPINLRDSENMTRLMSIHAAKGNGAKIVFLLELSEFKLKCMTDGLINIVYESLLHVAFTRHKQHLIVGLTDMDDISSRIVDSGFEIDNTLAFISGRFTTNKMIMLMDNDYHIFKDTIENNKHLLDNLKNINTNTIEWNYHILRFSSLINTFKLLILQNLNHYKDNDKLCYQNHEIYQQLNGIKDKKFEVGDYNIFLKNLNEITENIKNSKYDSNNKFVLLNNSLVDHLVDLCNRILTKIKDTTSKREDEESFSMTNKRFKNLKFCPLESTIITIIIDIFKNGKFTSYNYSELYSIIRSYIGIYKCSENIKHSSYYNCVCDCIFNPGDNHSFKESDDDKIYKHFSDLYYVENIFNNYIKYDGIYEIKDYLKYNGPVHKMWPENDGGVNIHVNDILTAKIEDNQIIIFIFKPIFNKLCHEEMIIEAIIRKYVYSKKYPNYEIKQFIITLSSEIPLELNIDYIDISPQVKNCIYKYLSEKHELIYNYYIKNGLETTHGDVKV